MWWIKSYRPAFRILETMTLENIISNWSKTGIEEEVKKWYETRELANESAIKKANEIYNNKNR